jgi:hypothetical protein
MVARTKFLSYSCSARRDLSNGLSHDRIRFRAVNYNFTLFIHRNYTACQIMILKENICCIIFIMLYQLYNIYINIWHDFVPHFFINISVPMALQIDFIFPFLLHSVVSSLWGSLTMFPSFFHLFIHFSGTGGSPTPTVQPSIFSISTTSHLLIHVPSQSGNIKAQTSIFLGIFSSLSCLIIFPIIQSIHLLYMM